MLAAVWAWDSGLHLAGTTVTGAPKLSQRARHVGLIHSSPEDKPCAQDQNHSRQEEGDIGAVDGQKDAPAPPVVLLLEPPQQGPKDLEALQTKQAACSCSLLGLMAQLGRMALAAPGAESGTTDMVPEAG